MAKTIDVLLEEFQKVQHDGILKALWFNSLESVEQLTLWEAYQTSEEKHPVNRHCYRTSPTPTLDEYDRRDR